MLEIDECAEWPILDCDRRLRLEMGPPLSETGSKEEGARSWPASGRGRRDEGVDVGLLVKVKETAAFGRVGLVCRVVFSLTLRLSVSFPESKTSPSPISKPVMKSSLTSARFTACFSGV